MELVGYDSQDKHLTCFRKWPETLVVPTMMSSALPWQNMEVLEKSGGDNLPKIACFSYYCLLILQLLDLCVSKFPWRRFLRKHEWSGGWITAASWENTGWYCVLHAFSFISEKYMLVSYNFASSLEVRWIHPIFCLFQLRKERILEDQSAECDMDIQRILNSIPPFFTSKHC